MVRPRQTLIWLSLTRAVTWILLLSGPQVFSSVKWYGAISLPPPYTLVMWRRASWSVMAFSWCSIKEPPPRLGGLDLLTVSDRGTVPYFLGPLVFSFVKRSDPRHAFPQLCCSWNSASLVTVFSETHLNCTSGEGMKSLPSWEGLEVEVGAGIAVSDSRGE